MHKITKLIALALSLAAAAAEAAPADLQFFGDVYVPDRVIRETKTTEENPAVFDGMKSLLASATHNVVNLEGPVSSAFVSQEMKRFLLRMPFTLPAVLRAAGINVATLANNHAMDYGYQGVFDTQVALTASGISYTGAGKDRQEATKPVILSAGGKSYCVLAYSKTLPQGFWATETTPGTASVTVEQLMAEVAACASSGLFTIAAFHWGQEMTEKVSPYQKELAHRAIEAGARLVLGHHPHRLQAMEIYKERPILYSLGNFAFGSLPESSGQEGLSVRVVRGGLELVPLVVNNGKVRFKPRPLLDGEPDPLRPHMPALHPCRWQKSEKLWSCPFGESFTSMK